MSSPSTNPSLSAFFAMQNVPDDIGTALVTSDEISVVPVEDASDGDATEVGGSVLRSENFEVGLDGLRADLDPATAGGTLSASVL
ncbi:hypothetical protein [Salinibacter altiplanensis]|uniref:hypothetical protein n=1 Tax=Salinibacter altiplanensis TaxID=1803181 RepID=UPI0013000F97|nr:hypothetical protein [Salinibacter altiplanensis]